MPAQEMDVRPNYFGTSYFEADCATGVIRNRAGRRVVALTPDFLVGFREALEHECGPAASEVLYNCGLEFGRMFAERLSRDLEAYYERAAVDMPMAMFDGTLAEAFARHGFGRLTLDYSDYAHGVIVARVRGTIFSSFAGAAKKPVDGMTAGILAGLLSFYTDQSLGCVQTECEACGAEAGRFIIALVDRLKKVPAWLDQGKTHDEVVEMLQHVRTGS